MKRYRKKINVKTHFRQTLYRDGCLKMNSPNQETPEVHYGAGNQAGSILNVTMEVIFENSSVFCRTL